MNKGIKKIGPLLIVMNDEFWKNVSEDRTLFEPHEITFQCLDCERIFHVEEGTEDQTVRCPFHAEG